MEETFFEWLNKLLENPSQLGEYVYIATNGIVGPISVIVTFFVLAIFITKVSRTPLSFFKVGLISSLLTSVVALLLYSLRFVQKLHTLAAPIFLLCFFMGILIIKKRNQQP